MTPTSSHECIEKRKGREVYRRMKRKKRLAAFLAITLTLLSSNFTVLAEEPADEIMVSGTVTDTNGYDMDGAVVTFTGINTNGQTKTYTTQVADGAYSLGMAAGTYQAAVTLGGSQIFITSGGIVTVDSDSVTHDIALEASFLIRQVSGQLTEENGYNLDGAVVTLTGVGQSFETVLTNGSYSVCVPEGTYTITAEKPGYTIEIKDGASIEVADGDVFRDISAAATPNTHTVSGKLKDNGARLEEGGTIMFSGWCTADGTRKVFTGTLTKDEAGGSHKYIFEVAGVWEGTYDVTVTGPITIGGESKCIPVMVPYDGRVTVQDTDVFMNDTEVNSSYAAGTVSGIVTDTGGASLEGAMIRFTGMSFGFDRTYSARIDGNGHYDKTVLVKNQDGKGGYTITVEKPGYSVEVQSGGPITVSEDGVDMPDTNVTVISTQNKGTVSGSVAGSGAEFLDGASVTLSGTSVVGGIQEFTGTVADGSYTINDVPEGIYGLTIAKAGVTSAVTAGGIVTVKDTDVTNDVELLAPIPAATVKGAVKDNDGFAVTGATVTFTQTGTAGGQAKAFTALTDKAGKYSVDVPEGSYEATVEKPGYVISVVSGGTVSDVSGEKENDIKVTCKDSKWIQVQELIDQAEENEVIDITALCFTTADVTLSISKNITLRVEPSDKPFAQIEIKNLFFDLSDNATLTLENVGITNTRLDKSVISGTGNVVLSKSILQPSTANGTTTVYDPPATIDVAGDVTVRTDADLFSCIVAGATILERNSGNAGQAGAAIKAVNVTVEGSLVQGGASFESNCDGGDAIIASGNVTISGGAEVQAGSMGVSTENTTVGLPVRFTEDPDTQRVLSVKGAHVFGNKRSGNGSAAPYTIKMSAKDIAIIDDSAIGWYTDMPVFSEGFYYIANPVNTWGTLDNATEVYNLAVTGAAVSGTKVVKQGDTDMHYAPKDADITIQADTPAAGKQFKEWTVVSGGITLADSKSATTTFAMPGKDTAVTVAAVYEDIPEPPKAPEYSYTEGANSQWNVGSDKGLAVKTNGDFAKFKGVKVNGAWIDASCYTVNSEDGNVTLKPEYLKTLKAGTYRLAVVYTDGEAVTSFTVKDGGKLVDGAVDTGDNAASGFWIVLMALAAGTAVLTGRKRYKEK